MPTALYAHNPRVDFDWDDANDAKLRAGRGFGFADVIGIFEARTIIRPDLSKNYGEVRMTAIGTVEGRFFTVAYTDRDGVRRLITAWPSSGKERALWQE